MIHNIKTIEKLNKSKKIITNDNINKEYTTPNKNRKTKHINTIANIYNS